MGMRVYGVWLTFWRLESHRGQGVIFNIHFENQPRASNSPPPVSLSLLVWG